jgi:solute carrier family 12 (potassium/chloride transporters), member 9
MNYLRFKRRIFPVTMDNENSNITHLRSITDDQESVQKRLDDLVEEGPDVSRYSVIEPLDLTKKLGTYIGVYRPTVLTIFGVIMYVRMGWVVGNAGLLGALMILLLTFLITGTAAASFSSITTNIRLQAGGVFALVSQSLGLEAGGAIGLPLFLAQSLGAALYIYGFAEGWSYLFPGHKIGWVLLCIYIVGASLAFISEKLVLKLQGVVLLGVVGALGSMIGGFWTVTEFHQPQLWGEFESGSIWVLFAVFFPAGTGIKVGASLSGKLKDPRRSIPLGTLSAWGTTLIVYAILMIWYSVVATPAELTGNYLIAVEKSIWGDVVIVGLLSSCASAMLSSMVAAPNVLAALGNHGIIPKAKFLAKQSKGGTYRNAVMVNSAIVGVALLLGDLNRVAALITMFFLITYATINTVIVIEQKLGLLSFRPTFKIPMRVPVVGAISSIFAMVIVNPIFGLIALSIIISLYIYLEKRHLETPWETVRSGMFLALADWAARQAQKMTGANERAWKPDMLVPVDNMEQLQGKYRILTDLLKPKGSIQVLYLDKDDSVTETVPQRLQEMTRDFQKESLFATSAIVKADNIPEMVNMGTSVLKGSFFSPNILYIDIQNRTDEEINKLVELARKSKMGVALFVLHDVARLSRERDINIWIRDQSPDWTLGLRLANLDLAILLGYQLKRNWGGKLCLLSAIRDPSQVQMGRVFLERLFKDARLPGDSSIWVESCAFEKALTIAPKADLNVFGLSHNLSIEKLKSFTRLTNSSCLFVIDSGNESALA